MKVTKIENNEKVNMLLFGETDLDYCGFARFRSGFSIIDIGLVDDLALEPILQHNDLYEMQSKTEMRFNAIDQTIIKGELSQEFIGVQYSEFDLKFKLITIHAYCNHVLKQVIPSFIEVNDHFNQSKIKNMISNFKLNYDELSFKSNVSNKFYNISLKNNSGSGFYPLEILGENFTTQVTISPFKGYSLLNFATKDLTMTEAWDCFLFHQLSCFLLLNQYKTLSLSDDDINMLKEYRCVDLPELFTKEFP